MFLVLIARAVKKVRGKEDDTSLICLVPELCYITGLDEKLRKNMTTMRSLANITRITANERDMALRKYLDSVNSKRFFMKYRQLLINNGTFLDNPKASSVLSEWGLRLCAEPLNVKGRVLEPERIFLGKAVFSTNPQCDWSRNLSSDIINPVRIQNWILVSTERDRPKAFEFSDCLMDVGRKMGIQVSPPIVVALQNDRTDTYVNRIRDSISKEVNT